MIESDFELY